MWLAALGFSAHFLFTAKRFPICDDDHRRFNLSPKKLTRYLSQLNTMQALFDLYPTQTMAQISLRFCISHPACHTVIPGAKSVVQVHDNCAASDIGSLPVSDLALISE